MTWSGMAPAPYGPGIPWVPEEKLTIDVGMPYPEKPPSAPVSPAMVAGVLLIGVALFLGWKSVG